MKYCLKCGVNYLEVIQQGREYCGNTSNHYGTYIALLQCEYERIELVNSFFQEEEYRQGTFGSVVDAKVVKATFNRGLEEPDLLIQWDDSMQRCWVPAAYVKNVEI